MSGKYVTEKDGASKLFPNLCFQNITGNRKSVPSLLNEKYEKYAQDADKRIFTDKILQHNIYTDAKYTLYKNQRK